MMQQPSIAIRSCIRPRTRMLFHCGRSSLIMLFCCCYCCLLIHTNAFVLAFSTMTTHTKTTAVIQNVRQTSSLSSMMMTISNSNQNQRFRQNEENQAREGWSTLRFRANLSYTSPPAPLPPFHQPIQKEKAPADFLEQEYSRNQLLSGSGNLHPSSMLSLTNHETTSLWLRWQDEARRFLPEVAKATGAAKSSKTNVDFIRLRMQTSFLVFTIIATAILGHYRLISSPITHSNEKTSPEDYNSGIRTHEHTLLLLHEDFQVQGPPPLVWIFEQLTGAQRRESEPSKKHTHHGFFRYWAESIRDNNVVFRSETQAEIGFEFPSFLLKILPVPKEVIEEQGNVSLKKSMQRDVSAGMLKLRQAYLRWLDSNAGSQSELKS